MRSVLDVFSPDTPDSKKEENDTQKKLKSSCLDYSVTPPKMARHS